MHQLLELGARQLVLVANRHRCARALLSVSSALRLERQLAPHEGHQLLAQAITGRLVPVAWKSIFFQQLFAQPRPLRLRPGVTAFRRPEES